MDAVRRCAEIADEWDGDISDAILAEFGLLPTSET